MADQDYLQNIAGSPHVDEGLGDRILSRGSSALQRLASVGGGNFSDPNYTKIDSLFNVFLKKVTPIVKDFSDGPHSVANRLGQMRPSITPQDEVGIKSINDLYDLLVPSHIRQHQAQHSVFSPRGSRSQLSELLKEGIFTRDMALNAALYSNNPSKIVAAYNKEIKKAYDVFMTDAMKVTGAPKDYVKRVVGNLNPSWNSVLGKVEQVIGVQPQPPVAPAPTTPPEAAAPDASGTEEPTTSPASADEESQLTAKNAQDDFVVLTANVVDILIAAVQGDEKLSAAFFKPSQDGQTPYEPLPQNWEQPSITKEAEEPEPAEPEASASPETGEDEPTGEKHEFLYNFHSLYRKQRHFAIDVPIHDKSKATFVTRQTKTTNNIQVVWSNSSHENNIYVKYAPKGPVSNEPEGKAKGGQVLLLKFWDNQVNPRNPESNKFSIELLLTQANQNAQKVMAGANADLKVALNKKTDELQRALYATTSRKRMEFKPKPFQLTHDEEGNVFRVKRDGTKVAISKDELKAHLTSKDAAERERWTSSLEKIGYFKKFPQDAPPEDEINIDKLPEAMDAVKALQALGHKSIASIKAVQSAVDTLGKDAKSADYVKQALATFKPATTAPTSTPVSSPASAPVTAPVSAPVSAPVTAPVSSDKPEPETAPAKAGEADLGKASWDEKGVITWEKPKDGKTVKLTPKQLMGMKIPRLELLLKQMGYFEKFPQALKEWLDEESVNPFDPANLL